MIIGDKARRNILVSTDHGTMVINRFDCDHNRVGHAQWLLDHGNADSIEAFVCIRLMEAIANPIMFDVGANIGTLPTIIANVLRHSEIYCFEPQHEVFKLLCGNLAINNLHSCSAFNLALGKANATVAVDEPNYSVPTDFGTFSLIEDKIPGKTGKSRIIDIVTLDSFVEKYKISGLDVLKIDAEGMDLDILQGAEKTLKKFMPRILVEHCDNQKSILDDLQQYLGFSDYNYKVLGNNLLAMPKIYQLPNFDDFINHG
jgi:FkbM family methyltransferase